MENFEYLLKIQRIGRLVCEGTPYISRSTIATYTVAMNDEILELARELGWKTWKPVPPVNKQRILEEMADVFAFFGTWMSIVQDVTGASVEEMWEAYLDKAELNRQRFAGSIEGYGVIHPSLIQLVEQDPMVNTAE